MKKYLIVVYVLVIGIIIFFTYQVIKDRYFSDDMNNVSKEEVEIDLNTIETVDNEEDLDEDEDLDDDSENVAINDNNEDINIFEETTSKNVLVDISPEDCQNECVDFSDEPKNLEYCRQVCGLAIPKEEPEECEELENEEKDYCLKDKAISQGYLELCEEIKDDNIKKTCQNRIVEELVE